MDPDARLKIIAAAKELLIQLGTAARGRPDCSEAEFALAVCRALVDYEGASVADRMAMRPSRYAQLSPGEQWEIDKALGILDAP